MRTATARVHIRTAALSTRQGRGCHERSGAARASTRTAAPYACQTRGWCRYALRRSGAAGFGRAVRWNTEAVGRGRARPAGRGAVSAIGLPGAGRHWRARSVGAGLCHGARDGVGARSVGRGVKPSAAGDTGYEANCAAKALMNPFTPTFPRYGAVIEINCYATNN